MALKQAGEEEGDHPHHNDSDHGPDSRDKNSSPTSAAKDSAGSSVLSASSADLLRIYLLYRKSTESFVKPMVRVVVNSVAKLI